MSGKEKQPKEEGLAGYLHRVLQGVPFKGGCKF